MKFTCAFTSRCKHPGVWAVQNAGKGGALVCEGHKTKAIAFYTHNGRAPEVWRDAYFEHAEQTELDLRFGDDSETNSKA